MRTPLHGFHLRHGARMVPFAGYTLPIQYAGGILSEHLQTRSSAGLFDVSHMGQVRIWPKSNSADDAALALERLVPADILGLAEGRQRYGLLTNREGGLLDDLMIARKRGHLLLVVNASRRAQDFAHLESGLGTEFRIEIIEDRALMALQGPASAAVLERIVPGVAAMKFMDAAEFEYGDAEIWVSRSGYTGEDGFEISAPAEIADALAESLAAMAEVGLAGLGARDSLRLESGLCLYGNDIDESTSPVEAGLGWTIPRARRTGGQREGGFPGDARILAELAAGTERRRVGLQPTGRAPMRQGTALYENQSNGERIGDVTSGGFGPTVGGPVAMGYALTSHSQVGNVVCGEVRGRRLPARICPLPFVGKRFKRQKG